ncbi:MAG: hypothetical protein M3N98_02665, partial [Actinomycetota bacterium]|nr:hypothetical protein [Actinomycetota bacterium]
MADKGGKKGARKRGTPAGPAPPHPPEPTGSRVRLGKAPAAPDQAHEWLSFPDPDEDRTWLFDVTFLLSGWHCLYGAGCQGVLTGPTPELEQGCCSYGAHFTDADDVARVKASAATLRPDQWQFRPRSPRAGLVKTEPDGSVVTRLVQGACIFLNRPGFAGGAGCALHRAALEDGRRPMDLKPDVCWQLPLRRQDSVDEAGQVTSSVTQWDRRHWGAGGAEFHWWCTEAPEAFGGHAPVYVHMGAELQGLCGAGVYAQLVTYLD